MDESPHEVAFALLQASWESDSSPQRYRSYATEALDTNRRLLETSYAGHTDWLRDQFIAGELERRLGRFAEAQARFGKLQAAPGLESDQFKEILELQLTLLADGSAEPKTLAKKR